MCYIVLSLILKCVVSCEQLIRSTFAMLWIGEIKSAVTLNDLHKWIESFISYLSMLRKFNMIGTSLGRWRVPYKKRAFMEHVGG